MKKLIILTLILLNGCAYSTMIVCPDGRKVITSGFGIEKDISCVDPETKTKENDSE